MAIGVSASTRDEVIDQLVALHVAADPGHVLPSCIIGSAIAGGTLIWPRLPASEHAGSRGFVIAGRRPPPFSAKVLCAT